MKRWLFLGILGVGVAGLIGGWLWQRTQQTAEPVVFENAPLEFPETINDAPADKLEPAPESADEKPQQPIESVKPAEPEATPSVPRASSTVTIIDRIIPFGFRVPTAARTINTVVVHSSYNASGGSAYDVDKVIRQYEQYGVGAHYLIDRSGKIYRLVAEGNIAYHAGESKMPDGRKNVNDFSIGIELIGTEESGYTDSQYTALNELIADIKTRNKIRDIVGHGDIAPKRKTDPWKFDWKRLK